MNLCGLIKLTNHKFIHCWDFDWKIEIVKEFIYE